MKFDEFHRLVRAYGWVKLRQMGTSHVIYKKGPGLIRFLTTKGKK